MKLRMWSVNPDGLLLGEDFWTEVKDREHASSLIVGELYETASDTFLHAALTEWFATGKVNKLAEAVNDTAFWNVELLDD